MGTITVTIDYADWYSILEARRTQIEQSFGWTIPDPIFDYFTEQLEELGETHSSPASWVDNLAVNHSCFSLEKENVEEIIDLLYSDYSFKDLSEASQNELIEAIKELDENAEFNGDEWILKGGWFFNRGF